MEQWKDIHGFEKYYQISNLGRVRSKYIAIVKSDGRKYTRIEKILKLSTDKDGYLRVSLKAEGISKMFYVHRLVAMHFIGGHVDGLQVNHINGNKQDNQVSNLEWVTCKLNINHAWNTGLATNKHNRKSITCLTTGKEFSSVQECIKQSGFSQTHFYRHLKGEIGSLGGLVYARL